MYHLGSPEDYTPVLMLNLGAVGLNVSEVRRTRPFVEHGSTVYRITFSGELLTDMRERILRALRGHDLMLVALGVTPEKNYAVILANESMCRYIQERC